MKCTETSLPGVLMIEPMVFEDDRGFFMETYHTGKYTKAGLEASFVQDNLSHSKRFTLRGLHYQRNHPQGKLVYVVTGEVLDIAVDIRWGSPTFGRWTETLLSAENRRQLYVPEDFAHGFCVLSETADVIYKCTDLYAPGDEYGILWSDPTLDISWPVDNPILSEKDAKNPRLTDVPEALLPVYHP
ncbi:MAG: dTDP-4-dehydrorhamnose 3,5-epimerase [Deltaproteobacteria bacterium]|nr:dTDP-4-dehydrorhamnose 3,5-epimerase [Deltaproteobacteria bacterium]